MSGYDGGPDINMSLWDVDNEKDMSGYYGGLEKDKT